MKAKAALPDASHLVFAAMAGWHALIFLVSIIAQRPIYPLGYFGLGIDFADFHQAAQDLIAGLDPYARHRFVTPPLSAVVMTPLGLLARDIATIAFLLINAACIIGGAWLMMRAFDLGRWQKGSLLMAIFLAPSAIMLLERGNIDGLVFLLIGTLFAAGSVGFRAVVLFAAIALKIYPLALIAPLAVARQFRLIGVTLALLALSLLLQFRGAGQFLANQIARGDMMRLPENLSGLAVPWALAGGTGPASRLALIAGVTLLAAAALTCVWYDLRILPRASKQVQQLLLISYAVFFVNFPPLVYLYSGIFGFAVLAAVTANADAIGQRLTLHFVAAVALTQFPALTLLLTAGDPPAWVMLHLVPSLGSIYLLVVSVWMRIHLDAELGASIPPVTKPAT